MKHYTTSLFIFRRDLRIEDNTGLRYALEQSETVIPCFIITPEQVSDLNPYRSYHAIQFMVESLKDLAQSLDEHQGKLYLFHMSPQQGVEYLIISQNIDAVFVNKDYTPYSRERDAGLEKICKHHDVAFTSYADALLVEPEDGLSDSGAPYKVYTPFYKKNRVHPIAQPYYHRRNNYATHGITKEENLSFLDTLYPEQIDLRTRGGRRVGKKILADLEQFQDYNNIRNDLSQSTTNLSAHNKFGTVSIREVAHAILDKIGPENGLLRQLYWRDFFYHVAWHYPYVFGRSFQEKYENITWNRSKKDFERWCTGITGFPIVDAGMRQMNATGYMHNRARLIVGSFLTKDLHISWQWGEQYFARTLEDYDPCVNNGSWQWVASTGCDSQPYFRIFNPWLQQKRYDPDCTYIKTWIPELQHVDVATIHNWFKQPKELNGYPIPMLDHKAAAEKAKTLYKEAATS